MSTQQTTLEAVHELQRQLDTALGRGSLASHLAHPLNADIQPILAPWLCNNLTSALTNLESVLGASHLSIASMSRAVSSFKEFSNEKQLSFKLTTAQATARASTSSSTSRGFPLPRQDLASVLEHIAKSCRFEVFQEEHVMTLAGSVCVIDVDLAQDRLSAAKVKFSCGAESRQDEQMDEMLLALLQADVLDGLEHALRDIKHLDEVAAPGTEDYFASMKALVQQQSESVFKDLRPLIYQNSPILSFLLHMPALDRLETNMDGYPHAPGSLAQQLSGAQVAKVHIHRTQDASSSSSSSSQQQYSLSLEPPLAFTRSTGAQLMQSMGKLDFSMPSSSSTTSGNPVWIEDLLTSRSPITSVERYNATNVYKHDLPDCKPITFSLGSPASERGFLLPSLKLDSLEQLNSVLPLLQKQAQMNVLFQSAFAEEAIVKVSGTDEATDALVQSTEAAPSSSTDIDLDTEPSETSVEVHWQDGRLSMVLPLQGGNSSETDLHVVDVGLDGTARLDGEPEDKLSEVLSRSSHLALSVRWLVEKQAQVD